MKASRWVLMILVSLPLVLAGCDESKVDAPKASTPMGKEAEQEYDIAGKVVSIGPDKRSVTLDHKDVPGLMKGMEMEFRVDDPKVLEGIEIGDEVGGRLRVQAGKYTITKLEKH